MGPGPPRHCRVSTVAKLCGVLSDPEPLPALTSWCRGASTRVAPAALGNTPTASLSLSGPPWESDTYPPNERWEPSCDLESFPEMATAFITRGLGALEGQSAT